MNKRKQGAPARASRPADSKRHSRAARRSRTAQSRADTPPPASEVYAFTAECTVANSTALKSGLMSLLEQPAPVTLDAAAVQRIDTSGMQLIAAFVRERESHGRRVEWRGTAPVFISAARLLGLASVLRLPEPAQ